MESRTVTGSPVRTRRGFTLIELLVVMSIIGVLLTIAVPRYFRTLERSRETVLRTDLDVMREAIDKHYGDLGQYPDSLMALVEDPDHPGIRDVHSGAPGKGQDGTALSEW
jgi:general secretion pathway protein G